VTVVDLRAPREHGSTIDPFELPAAAPAPSRPRLLSYVGRWGRARRWLPKDARRVLDVGCAFGYGSAAIGAGGPAGRVVIGVERDPGHLDVARERFPWITIIEADATELPFSDGCADAVILLDVIEHIADPERVLAEADRVLCPGGVLVLSVPHAGPLHWLDALNLYQSIRRRRPSWPPLEPATTSAGGTHRHFTPAELTALLAPRFAVERVARTGLGLEEIVYLAGLLLRVPRRTERVGAVTSIVHFIAYVLDDLIPAGALAHTVTIQARAGGAR
jgi:SAM-dependent methyltransferase